MAGTDIIWRITMESDAHWARERAAALARGLGLDEIEAGAVGIAVGELATNVVKYAGRGTLAMRPLAEGGRRGLEIVAEDEGQGFADPEAATIDGYSEGRLRTPDDPPGQGLGAGLGAVKRLMDELEIDNLPGGGARVVARKWTT